MWRSTSSTVSSWPSPTPNASSVLRYREMPDSKTMTAAGGHSFGIEAIALEHVGQAVELHAPELARVLDHDGLDRLAVVRQRDELGHQRRARLVVHRVPHGPQRLR